MSLHVSIHQTSSTALSADTRHTCREYLHDSAVRIPLVNCALEIPLLNILCQVLLNCRPCSKMPVYWYKLKALVVTEPAIRKGAVCLFNWICIPCQLKMQQNGWTPILSDVRRLSDIFYFQELTPCDLLTGLLLCNRYAIMLLHAKLNIEVYAFEGVLALMSLRVWICPSVVCGFSGYVGVVLVGCLSCCH